jgi:hypothetical protein
MKPRWLGRATALLRRLWSRPKAAGPTTAPPSPAEFARSVRLRHSSAFRRHREVALLLQDAVARRRPHQDIVARAVDMLFVQAFKAHHAVYELASYALVEDTATIVRRLLELAIQAVYISRDSEEATRLDRAGKFLAFLWHKWPADLRDRLPRDERRAWESVYATYGRDFKPERKQWGPPFFEMFKYAEQPVTYAEDYSLLSNIAHGSPPSLVHEYANPTVEIHSDRLVPLLVNYGSRYALGMALLWDDIFHLLDAAKAKTLLDAMTKSDN